MSKFGIAIDFETAGYYAHSACAVGLTKVVDGRPEEQFYSLIRPPSKRIYFTWVHGLEWKDLKDAETFTEVWNKARQFIGNASFFIAHNAPFDRKVLYACCAAFNQPLPAAPFLCTLKGARKKIKLPSRSLENLCAYFHIDLEHHHAASDARACALIYGELKKLGVTDEDMRLKDING